MRMQDFLIGIGLFAVFTFVIFGAINPNNEESPYNEQYLNVTHDTLIQKAITNITSVSSTSRDDFDSIATDAQDYTNSGTDEERSESNIIKDAINFLFSLPKAYKPVTNVLRMISEKFKVPTIFTNWAINSIIIIFILMIVTAVVKNKVET